jgi:AhpD family alkylhydroperoxidase
MDEKMKEMIAIGASIGAHCQPCLEYHVGKGRAAGLSEGEIREAIAVGHMVEKGSMTAMKQFSDGVLHAQAKPASGGCCCSGSAPSKKGGCCC